MCETFTAKTSVERSGKGTWKFRVELRRKVKALNTDVEFYQIWPLVGYWSLREQSGNSGWLRQEYTQLRSGWKVSYIVSELFLTIFYVYFLFLPVKGNSLGQAHDRPPCMPTGTNKHLLSWRSVVEREQVDRKTFPQTALESGLGSPWDCRQQLFLPHLCKENSGFLMAEGLCLFSMEQ